MYDNPTVIITVKLNEIFAAIKSKVVYCKDNFAMVGDTFISYEVDKQSDPDSLIDISGPSGDSFDPPTITIKPGTTVDFVVNPTDNDGQPVYFEWFHDPALKALRLGVASNATRYQALDNAQFPVDVTMTIIAQFDIQGQSEEFTIGWDPIIVVKDVDPQ
ncbi:MULTISPECIES: hypothetical protein [Pseudoalteromonas]|uniref:hypothetical protein n=1 Tax=Pseudoalteromonas TaxID=53246 RepID=UPI00026CCD87|nr:hypothetical protein [Pseudoalteromonas spongiae]ATD00524.1 hypothetical protein PSPO_b0515 [Pseudoalteromonas spongiae UST010723-006]